jgi:hypothetical protein
MAEIGNELAAVSACWRWHGDAFNGIRAHPRPEQLRRPDAARSCHRRVIRLEGAAGRERVQALQAALPVSATTAATATAPLGCVVGGRLGTRRQFLTS